MNDVFNDGLRLFKNKRYERALSVFLSINDNSVENPELSYYLGLCCVKLEKYEDALLYLEQVVTTHTNLLNIYQSRMIIGYIYCVTRRYELAELELKNLLNGGYESAQLYSAFGYISYTLGKIEESLNFFHKALNLDADNTNALNSIGYILAEGNIDSAGAISYCKAAVRIKPESYAYLDSLGWACFKAGDKKEARIYLRKALNIAGKNKIIAAHLKTVIDSEK